MHQILRNRHISKTAKQLGELMEQLSAREDVVLAVLATDDGLAIERGEAAETQLAAVAGFMRTAAQQSFTMLGLSQTNEIVIRSANNELLICRSFQTSGANLILTIVFTQDIAYKRLVQQTMSAIRQAMEK